MVKREKVQQEEVRETGDSLRAAAVAQREEARALVEEKLKLVTNEAELIRVQGEVDGKRRQAQLLENRARVLDLQGAEEERSAARAKREEILADVATLREQVGELDQGLLEAFASAWDLLQEDLDAGAAIARAVEQANSLAESCGAEKLPGSQPRVWGILQRSLVAGQVFEELVRAYFQQKCAIVDALKVAGGRKPRFTEPTVETLSRWGVIGPEHIFGDRE